MMTKEQYFTFKSDMKNGMRIEKLTKSHRKAYYNDGFKSQAEQDDAIKKDREEIKSLQNSIIAKTKSVTWVSGKGYVDTEIPFVLGESPEHHWAYYCAKHKLEGDDAITYISGELDKLTERKKGWYGIPFRKPDSIYEKYVKPILTKYEEIVCTD